MWHGLVRFHLHVLVCARCETCKFTCPVHVLWPYFEKLPVGTKPFQGITPAKSLKTLRMMLDRLGVQGAFAYRCHDIRRGHANDMLQRGRSLYEILMAGEWRSPAFMTYLDMCELERGAVIEAHADESSSEDEDLDA